MKPSPLLLALCLSLFGALAALAAPKTPNLVGTWVSEYPVGLHHGFGRSVQTIVITEQKGENFRGVREWTRKEFHGAKGATEPKLVTAKSAFAGVVGFDEKSVSLADRGAVAIMTGRLTKPNELQLVFLKPGDPAVAFRATFVRK